MKYIRSDILQYQGTITVPVNMVGVMGAGLAKQASLKIPTLLGEYRKAIASKDLSITTPTLVCEDKVLLFATKQHWKNPSQLEWIEKGLIYLRECLMSAKMEIEDLALPKLGCGLGGLEWSDVNTLFKKYLTDLPINCRIYI